MPKVWKEVAKQDVQQIWKCTTPSCNLQTIPVCVSLHSLRVGCVQCEECDKELTYVRTEVLTEEK